MRIVYLSIGGRGGSQWNLMQVPLAGPHTPRLLVSGHPRVADGHVSPSGGWLAYMSDESGQWEVYLTRYPSCEGRWQVSVAGGQWPRWNGKGDRLYFCQAEDIMEVEVSGVATPTLGAPTRRFGRPGLGPGLFGWYLPFDVTRDGKRFLILRSAGETGPTQGVTVVQGWAAEFAKRRAPASR